MDATTLNHNLVFPAAVTGIQEFQQASTAAFCNLAALTLAMGSQDVYTQGHGRRVAAYAERIARRIGLAAEEIEPLRIGGLLHDIGKIAFSPKLLTNTRTRLSASMRAEIRRHPEIGREFLKVLNMAEPVIDCVHYHHERVDGTGYPRGLKADQIPLGAKIISVADCFDALTTDRPYQRGKRPVDALQTLKHLVGRNLCPELTRVFSADVQENGPEQSLELDLQSVRFGLK
jgi:putative nucleotidyltransferase with HDIG domain